jgi:aminomethyltransferase
MAFDPATVVRHYGDPSGEVHACRTACALFDFSFVARARVQGPGALAAIAQLTHRPLGDLLPGRIRYALREDANSHLVSDLTIWRHDDHYEVMSGRAEDIADLIASAPQDASAQDLSGAHAIFAVQGPGSLAALAAHMDGQAIAKLTYFAFAPAQIEGVPCLVGRLGYTGEAGFEIILPRAEAQRIWSLLARSARPAGFIAADVLRIEAGFVLFTNEFRMAVTAREAGLERFAGASAAPAGQDIALVCFQASTREKPVLWHPAGPVARPGPGTITITSACHSLAAGGALGLGFAQRADVLAGAPLSDPRGAFTDIRLVPIPFFDPEKRRPRAPWAAGAS